MPAGTAFRRAAWLGTALAVAWFWLVATGFQPGELFDRGPFTADFYEVQARALSRGRLAVPAEVVGIEGYLVDGETHLYYGLVPALSRLPVAAFTDALDGRLVVLSQLFGVAVASLASARLLWRGGDAMGASVSLSLSLSPWIAGAFPFAVGAASPLLWLAARPLVYHEAELWGAALALVGFERVVAWWTTRGPRDLVLASVAGALAVSTRASTGLGPVLALTLLAVVLVAQSSFKRAQVRHTYLSARKRWAPLGRSPFARAEVRHTTLSALKGRLGGVAWVMLAALVPVVLYAAVNLNRFGTLWSIPFDRQVLNEFSAERRAALADNGGTLFGLKFLPTSVLQYLRPDTLRPQSLLPWLTWGPPARVLGGVTFDTIDRTASLPVAAPWLLALSVPGLGAVVRRRVPAAWAACLVGGVVAVIPILTIAFVANRYLADFVPPLVVAAALGVPVVAGWLRSRSVALRRTVVGVGAALVAMAFVVNGALALLSQRLYLLPEEAAQRGFIGLQYDVHDLVPGGAPPNLSMSDEGLPAEPGPDGALLVVGGCDGLYRSDGTNWRVVELRPGGRFRQTLTGPLVPGLLAQGDGWRVDIVEAGGGRVAARYRSDDGTTVTGEPREPPAGDVVLDLTADPAGSIVRVRLGVDGDELLGAFLVGTEGPVDRAEGWEPSLGSAPLCERLVARQPAQAQRGSSTTMNW